MKKLFSFCGAIALSATVFASGHVATTTKTDATCNGVCNGTANGYATGGIGPYGYSWSGAGSFSSSLQNITGLCAGTYTLTATDSSDMSTATATAVIAEPVSIAAAMSATGVSCYGSCDGNAIAIPTGGTGAYTYIWTGTTPGPYAGQGTPNLTSLCPGTYSVTVTDVNGCSLMDLVTVTEPTPVVIAPISPSTICTGASASIIAGATGGTPPYTYIWTPGAVTGSTIVVSPTSTTSYTVMATDANGCTSAAGLVTIIVDPPITISISSTNASCLASCDGTATSVATGGAGPYVYLWTPGGITTPSAYSLCSGTTYSVSVSDATGCVSTDSIILSNDPSPRSNFSMVPDSAAAMSYWAFDASVGTNLNYIWYFGDGDSSFVASPTHVYPAPGTYNICLIVSNAINPAGCFDVVCDSVVVASTPSSCLALFNAARDTVGTNPNAYIITDLSYGATLNYSWDFGDGTTSTLHHPTHSYAGTGAYQICLTVDNGVGCTQTFCDSISWIDSLAARSSVPLMIAVVDGPASPFATGVHETIKDIHVVAYPNPFNDVTTFEISGRGTETYSFEMFDVLGKQVKQIKGIAGNKFEISRTGLQNGVYFYKIYSTESTVVVGKLVIQ